LIPPYKHHHELERLEALASYAVLDTLSEPEFDDITLLASQICEVPIALISFVDGDLQWFKSRVGIEATETARDISFCGHAIHGSALFEINNAQEDIRFFDNPLVTGAPNIRFYAGMPLVTEEGHALGTLCVIDQRPRTLTDQQKASLAALARQVMKLLESRISVKKMALLTEEIDKKAALNIALLDSTEACIFSFSMDGVVQKFNLAGQKLLGYSEDEVVGVASLATFLDPVELHYRAQMVGSLPTTGKVDAIKVVLAYEKLQKSETQEWVYVHKNQSTFPVALTVSAIEYENECVGFVAIAQDISQQKANEYSLALANTQFEASLEAISDMVWVKNLSGEYIQCNRSFERCLGIDKKDIIGKRDIDFFDAESAEFYLSKDLEAIESNFPLLSEEWITFLDGYHGLFEVTKTATKDLNGKAVGVMSIAHDITQRKLTELKVRSHREAMLALNEISSDNKAKNYQEQISLGLKVACDYLGMMFGVLSQVHRDATEIEAQHSPEDTLYEGLAYPLSDTYCALTLESTDVVFAQNMAQSSYALEKCYQLFGYQSFIGQQLIIDERLYGTLIFYNYQPRYTAFESVEIDFIKLLSRWIINIIRRNQLVEKINFANERVNLALHGADLGLWDLDLQTNKTFFNDRWAEMLGYKLPELALNYETWTNLLHPEDAKDAIKKVNTLIAGESTEFNIEFRMRHKEGHWIWVQDRGRVVERDAFGKPTRMVGTHMDITERKRAEDEIRILAFYDSLTNLPNRRLLIDRLEHTLVTSARSKSYGALIFIDLDNFKTLNDTSGHDKGDALLKQVAMRLLSCLRDGDTVARFGGDEFVVMLDGLDTQEPIAMHQVEKVGEKIIASLNQPYDLGGQHYFSSPTLGATLFNGQTDNVDDSLKRADIAMYQAKSAGKNCLRFFDHHIQSNLLHKTKLEEDLRQAIDEDQFVLYFQPQVNINGHITGAEALIRWHHPQRGLVSPLEFIPLAEETGLIIQLGNWVLETGCKQLVEWMDDPIASHFDLSINVSARQFQQPNFVEQVLNMLEKTGAIAKNLKLELTESMLVNDIDDVITKMSQLQLKGVSFSLDDFGTGFSSLSLLKLLPLNQLKIDKSFVRDVLTDSNDAVIARTIVALARSLGLNVIAEGVEIEGQRDFLFENGCNDYQGYLFSRPLTIEAFEIYRKSLANQHVEMKTLWEKALLNETVKQYSLFY